MIELRRFFASTAVVPGVAGSEPLPGRRWADSGRCLRWRSRRETVAAHDLSELRRVRRTAAARRHHFVNLTKVAGSHASRTGDRQELGVLSGTVLKTVDHA